MTRNRRPPLDTVALQFPLAATTLLVAFVALGWLSAGLTFPLEGGLLSVALLMGGLLMLSGCTFRVGLLWSAGSLGWMAAWCAASGALQWAGLLAGLALVFGSFSSMSWRVGQLRQEHELRSGTGAKL